MNADRRPYEVSLFSIGKLFAFSALTLVGQHNSIKCSNKPQNIAVQQTLKVSLNRLLEQCLTGHKHGKTTQATETKIETVLWVSEERDVSQK